MFNLKNKKVIITGATGGIGNSILNSFVEQKARVLATGTNEEKLNAIKSYYQPLNLKIFIKLYTINHMILYLKIG